VVTGAGSGIGAALARRAAAEGMTVVLADITAERIQAAARAITDAGGVAHAVITDVSDSLSVARLADYTLEHAGVPALLANNAGIESLGSLWEFSPERWRQVQAVNVDGVFYGVRSFLPAMIEAGGIRHVLNTSSIGGISVGGFMTPYIVSKHAVRALSECLSIELEQVAPDIRVHVLLPGPVDTNIFRNAESTDRDGVGARNLERMREHLAAEGMPPAALADLTFDAMAADQFWIYPHPEMARQTLAHRARILIDRLRPSQVQQ
jgi:NAD(P)-dependent dehydrogenase (short-subunit alcohol dehydrogenase family)